MIGLGHISRCISLAEEFCFRGHFSCFAHLSELDWRGKELLSQSGLNLDCSCKALPDAVLYDSYDLDFVSKVPTPAQAKFILLIDDLSPTVIADAFIEASPIRTWKPPNASSRVLKFDSNPILRRVYDLPPNQTQFQAPFNVLISLGAAKDFADILSQLIPEIQKKKNVFNEITVLIGSNADAISILKSEFEDVNFICGTFDFRALIKPNSFIISAAGVTAWELISLRVPGFLIGVADNQVEQLEYFNKSGMRKGINFQNFKNFSVEIGNLIDTFKLFEPSRTVPVLLKNGRIQSVDWILSEILTHPNLQG